MKNKKTGCSEKGAEIGSLLERRPGTEIEELQRDVCLTMYKHSYTCLLLHGLQNISNLILSLLYPHSVMQLILPTLSVSTPQELP